MPPADDARWMAAAAALAERARPSASPNPGVAALVLQDGRVVGSGWTQPGGRPHAEAVALRQAGNFAKGAVVYVTLEPCAHRSARGPACADSLMAAGIARVVVGMIDPDPRTAGAGIARLRESGIAVTCLGWEADRLGLAPHQTAFDRSRPFVTLKLAMSMDGCIAAANGESQWITGGPARDHAHRERARHDAILVGGQTLRDDDPRLNVRLAGLEGRSPRRIVLTRKPAPPGWIALPSPLAVNTLDGVRTLMVEGGAGAAGAFLSAGLVDRLLIYRAPILLGGGRRGIETAGAGGLDAAFRGGWQLTDTRPLGRDRLEVYRPQPVERE